MKDGQIVMNISDGATRHLMLDNEWIQFSARFGGVSHEISIPVDRVAAIFARENGQGLHFEPTDSTNPSDPEASPPSDGAPVSPKGKPTLKVVK